MNFADHLRMYPQKYEYNECINIKLVLNKDVFEQLEQENIDTLLALYIQKTVN